MAAGTQLTGGTKHEQARNYVLDPRSTLSGVGSTKAATTIPFATSIATVMSCAQRLAIERPEASGLPSIRRRSGRGRAMARTLSWRAAQFFAAAFTTAASSSSTLKGPL